MSITSEMAIDCKDNASKKSGYIIFAEIWNPELNP
jgi:hypothetical protein